MQRSQLLRSSHESAGWSRRCARRAACRSTTSARVGSRPFGGSTISDVRRSGLTRPRSNHSALYDPTLPGGGGRSRVTARFRSAASSAVKNSRSASASGRWSGVSDAYDHVPMRSGWPHGVRKSPPPAWPAAAAGHNHAAAATAASAETVRLSMLNLLARSIARPDAGGPPPRRRLRPRRAGKARKHGSTPAGAIRARDALRSFTTCPSAGPQFISCRCTSPGPDDDRACPRPPGPASE